MLIEIRIGPGKRKISNWIAHISQKCKIPLFKIYRVPHISLYGNFVADHNQVERIKTVLEDIGEKYSLLTVFD